MDSVKIIADSTCDLPGSLRERLDIDIVPLYVLLGDQAFKDGVDIDQDRIFEHFDKTQRTPTTSAASVQDFVDAFGPYARQGRDIVFIGISSEMSATCQNALLAAREFPGVTIRVADSRNLSSGIGLLVIKAAEMAGEGRTADAIADRITAMTGLVRASFVIDTLTYLYRGGRCSRLQMLGANALGLKPKIAVRDGQMGPEEKYRGRLSRVVEKYARDALSDLAGIDPARVFITHSRCDRDVVETALDAVRRAGYFQQIHDTDCGSVIASHCGPGTLGVLYMLKE
ncbi:MAG: Fatty acid-binding protein [Syntrophaceae bacterium PtaU1.Bin231]|nr:MAG: Fatty acid-binding protein [Syntrophaceae bacterium PtaU1.Bin231]